MKVVWSRTEYKGNVKTKTTTQNITTYVSKLQWSGASTQASRQVSITLANDPYDKNMNVPRIKPGDVIKVYAGKEKNPRFIGRVPNRQLTSDIGTIEIVAYDYMHNLLQSTMSKKFKNKTPEYITKAVLADLGVSAGKIAKTGVKIKKFFPSEMSPYNIIVAAYRKAAKTNGKKYFFRMNGTKFESIEKGEIYKTYLEEKVNITKSNYEENADDVVNKVVVFKNNKKVNTVKNNASIKKYGIVQRTISVDSGKGAKEAKNTLQGISKTASISTTGDWNCVAGKGVYVKDSASGLTGKYWISNDTHTFENGIHTMDLDLEFKEVMESVSVQEMDTSKKTSAKSSKTNSSKESSEKYIYQTKKKKATFTAYYPGENGEWVDSFGRRLIASKMTCAASRCIAHGTKITVKDTGTKYDGKTFKVNDRPATKYDMMDGRLHIDLLLSNHAECNDFGRRHGNILIKKKIKNPNYVRNSKADKVIKEAKKWVGQLSYSQANRQNFKPGGSADCSSFSHHCFSKIGIEIGSTTDDQPNAGHEVKKSKRKKGDLVFFHTCADRGQPYGATHVGICLSKKKFIHCSSARNGVVITSFSSYSPPLVAVRRVL